MADTARASLLDALEGLPGARRTPSGEWAARCPAHEDRVASLSWKVGGDGRALVTCHAGCSYAAIVAAVGLVEADGYIRSAPVPKLRGRRGSAKVTRYEVRDPDGSLAAVHVRRDLPDGSKTFTWNGPNGSVGLGGRSSRSLPLYGVERAAEWEVGRPLLVVEGEKAADALLRAGRQAVGIVSGAGTVPEAEVFRPLVGLSAVILSPDNDEPGRRLMLAVAPVVGQFVGEVKWLEPPADAPPGWDLADALDASDPVTVIRGLGDRIGPVPGVAPDAPRLADMLEQLAAWFSRYVVLPPGAADTLALWAAHTHAFAHAHSTPYLAVTSPDKRSGKTLVLEMLDLVAHASSGVLVQPSVASIFRSLADRPDGAPPTLLIDEVDTIFRRDLDDDAAQLRGLLNSGYRRGATVPRVTDRSGTVTRFDVFAPKALAGNGRLPGTLADRSIPIRMVRRLVSEPVAKFKYRHVTGEAAPMVADLRAALLDSPPADAADTPDELSDRAADIWEPLLAIADAAGGTWPARARRTAVVVSRVDDGDTEALGIRLLGDIRTVFREAGSPDRLPTTLLLERLRGLEEAPWSDLSSDRGGGGGLRAHRLATLLRAFGIRSHSIRVEGGKTPKGYLLEAFADAWARYLPPETAADGSVDPPAKSATPQRNLSSRGGVADRKGGNTNALEPETVAVPGS